MSELQTVNADVDPVVQCYGPQHEPVCRHISGEWIWHTTYILSQPKLEED